jgi:hypothetical protein
MTSREKRQYEMLVRVRDFGLAQADRFPKSTLGTDAFATVDAAVNALNEQAATQFSSRLAARGGPSMEIAACRSLLDMLDSIGATARAVALDTPGVEDRFRVPRRKGKVAVLSAARAFVSDVEPLAKQFVAHGMARDFVAQLTAKIEAFEEALKAREAERALNASARAALKGALDSGLAAVTRLDAIVRNVIGDDASAMATWAVARRIERFRGPGRSTTAAAPPAAASTPVTPQPVGA